MTETGTSISTKDRILNTAERLFAHHGFEATSLRAITAEAGVNIAAVNYHFQSKDALIAAVLARRIAPINAERLAMLDRCEKAAGDEPPRLECVLDAFVRPVLEIRKSQAKNFCPLMGRVFTEPGGFVESFFNEHMKEVARRFTEALHRAVPELSREELLWRAYFLIGAMAHTIGGARLLQVFSGGLCDTEDVDAVVARMVGAFSRVFRASVSEVTHAH